MKFFHNKSIIIGTLSLGNFFLMAMSVGFGSVYSTLERRFNFSSTQVGWLASMYDLSDGLFAIVLVHLIRNVPKNRAISVGMIFIAISGIICVIPHWINDSWTGEISCSTSRFSKNLLIFCLGQILLGISSAVPKVLCPVYLDENFDKKQWSVNLILNKHVIIKSQF